ncbi:MAG: hypothetical protein WCS92_00350 [Candidatus Babeliales bacterium]|jgi:hypothetical protein
MKNLSSQKNEPPTVPEQRNLVEVFLILMRVDQRNKRSKPVKEEFKLE